MTTASALPPIFLSHGSPMIALEPGAAGEFMQRLGPAIDLAFGRPRAIVAVSAHTLARRNAVLGAASHGTVHDFGGFPDALYELRYDAPGDRGVAQAVSERLVGAGFDAPLLTEGGLDHGIWTVLRHVYPNADVPIVPVAMRPMDPPATQFALGAALAALAADGVLVLGTGSFTHNLRRVFAGGRRFDGGEAEDPDCAAFRSWMDARATARDWDALLDYRVAAPQALDMHPTDEHLLPFYVAAGAGGREAPATRLHASITFGSLAMDAYAFGDAARRLAQALS